MNGTNTAVATESAPRWQAWIWFSQEIPTESPSTCAAHLYGEKETWGIELSWDGDIAHDEIIGEASWYGPELKLGDTLQLCEGKREVGVVRILGEVE